MKRILQKVLITVCVILVSLQFVACDAKKDFMVQYSVLGQVVETACYNNGETIDSLPELKDCAYQILGWYDAATGDKIEIGNAISKDVVAIAKTSVSIEKNSTSWLDDEATIEKLGKHYQLKITTTSDLSISASDMQKIALLKNVVLDFSEANFFENTFPENALKNDECLAQIVLPNTLETIDSGAFFGCKNLEAISFPAATKIIGEKAFYDCDKLEIISLPNGVTTIMGNAFSECNMLSSLSLYTNVTSIDKSFVDGCKNLKTISVEGKTNFYSENGVLYKIDQVAGGGGITTIYSLWRCPEGVEGTMSIDPNTCKINAYAFFNCSKISKAVLSTSNVLLYEIEEHAFFGCSKLFEVNLSASLKTIGDSAFLNCANLTNIDMSSLSLLETIDDNAFSGCSSISEVVLCDSVETIGDRAFLGCTSLVKVELGKTSASLLTTIGRRAFYRDCFHFSTSIKIFSSNTIAVGEATFGYALAKKIAIGIINPNNQKVYVQNTSASIIAWEDVYGSSAVNLSNIVFALH